MPNEEKGCMGMLKRSINDARFPYLSNSQDGRVILHPLPRTEKIPAQKCLCSSFHVVFPSFSPSLPVNRLPFSSFSASTLHGWLLHICTTYTYIYTYIFLFSRYENAIWICIVDSLGYCQWWAAMHNAALSVAHLHLLRHTHSLAHTRIDLHTLSPKKSAHNLSSDHSVSPT